MAKKKGQEEVEEKIIDLYSENIEIIPEDEFSPAEGSGTTEGFISREFKSISGTKTDKRGRTIFVGTKG